MATANPDDIDLMARTMVAENRSGSDDEYSAIANVIRNRTQSGNPEFGGNTVSQVLRAPRQFTPWGTATNNPMNVDKRSPAYQRAYGIASDTLNGIGKDATNGAVYYYNPKAPGQKTPNFAQGREGQQIGNHKFYGPMQGAKDTTGPADYAHLIKKDPEQTQPTQLAGDETAPTGKVGPADYAHLITGKEEEPPPPEAPEPAPEIDPSGGINLIGRGMQRAPIQTLQIGSGMLGLPLATTMAGMGGGAAMASMSPIARLLIGATTGPTALEHLINWGAGGNVSNITGPARGLLDIFAESVGH